MVPDALVRRVRRKNVGGASLWVRKVGRVVGRADRQPRRRVRRWKVVGLSRVGLDFGWWFLSDVLAEVIPSLSD